MSKLHLSSGSTAEPPFALVVTPETAGWGYSGLRVLELGPGQSHALDTGDEELLVLPLAGAATVEIGVRVDDRTTAERYQLAGRADVFDRVTDLAYAPRDSAVTVTSEGGGRFALPSARCRGRREPRYVAATDVPVETRGAGACSRQVVNFCGPDTDYADALIAVEVLTPGGNWSSYPPHKHDEARSGPNGPLEAELEEIYYFETRNGGPAYQRVYGAADRPIDVLAEVRTGDVVLIPHGWHGPSMAAPGYDLYYLNVMAGPGSESGDRRWLICDDPAHAWVRDTWAEQPVDPRLPLITPHSATERSGS